jgi:hypothetical protein
MFNTVSQSANNSWTSVTGERVAQAREPIIETYAWINESNTQTISY